MFARASGLGAAIFVHPWDMMGEERMRKYWLPWLVGMPAEVSLAICSLIFGGVLERLPGLRIAFAHGGGAFPGTLGRIEHGFRARPDLGLAHALDPLLDRVLNCDDVSASPIADEPAATYLAPPPIGAPFLEWDVSGVSLEDVATLRQFLERRVSLSPGARAHLATDLAARVRPKVVGAPDGWHPESFLEAVVAAKTARG